MSVVRVEKNKDYTVLSNYHLRDKSLSLKAKGLLSVVLSLPDNWDYSIEGLVSILKEEKRAVKNAIEELVQNKYLIILKLKATKNIRKNIEYIYTFYEKPFNQKDLTKLLNSFNKEEIMKYDCGVNLDGIDVNVDNIDIHNIDIHNVDIHNVCLQKDTQINKDIISKDIINKEELNTNATTTNNNNINNSELIENKSGGGGNEIIKQDKINLYEYVEQNFGRPLSPIEIDKIDTWKDNDLTRYAIKVAILNGKHTISYIEGILRKYKDNEIYTIEQAKTFDKKFRERGENRLTSKTKDDGFIPVPYKDTEGIWSYTDERGRLLYCKKLYKNSQNEWEMIDAYGNIRKCKEPISL